ncbi:hypothetical protein RMCBS344292_11101 [Rhizopus microsporus]|nr:hypothetical protein RMCBS344292_11101 [Rhizopus microsporus]
MLTTTHYAYPMKRIEEKGDMVTMIDYTNLYIKNLDINVTSAELFKLFRVFGHIISARVMKDANTTLSKGYGFVSFKRMEDAREALIQMNGCLVQTKHIIVNYHEHKKTVQQYQKMQTERNRQMIRNKSEVSYSPEQKFIQPWHETIWMHPMYPPMQNIPAVSPMTLQIQKLREAIDHQLLDYQKKDLNELVDLIQSLKKRELSLCLFNPAFLKQKIAEAYEVIHLFKYPENSIATTPSLDHHHLNDDDNDSSPNSSVAAILSSLEGMTLNKKKRVFGDIFFPYVKATGIRHAPKVTIHLLDTVPLDDLAFNMYDKKTLTKKAHQAYIEIYGDGSNAFRELH